MGLFAKRGSVPEGTPTYGGSIQRTAVPDIPKPEGCQADIWMDAYRRPGEPNEWRAGYLACRGFGKQWDTILQEQGTQPGAQQNIGSAVEQAAVSAEFRCLKCPLGPFVEVPENISNLYDTP